jgi:uncharacterized protein (DUF2235 family)
MPKNIILCSDGTGNTAIKGRGTNVFKLFEAVDLNEYRSDPRLDAQLAFYDDGVGTEGNALVKMLGGAAGYGLGRNVKKLYRELARVYDEGDRIFLFGFSRGAFTVRTLAGMIGACGILAGESFETAGRLRDAVDEAYAAYRALYDSRLKRLVGPWLGRPHDAKATETFKQRHRVHAPVEIEFVGVWDTVDAVGMPFALADFVNSWIRQFKFPTHTLGKHVLHACHALSLDDDRVAFEPVLWTAEPGDDRIDQVWFAGCHSNVGGGYPKQGLSLVALEWMLHHAAHRGLRLQPLDREIVRGHASADDMLYDPRAGLGIFYRWAPRDVRAYCVKSGIAPRLHVTVAERIAHGTDDYAPGNIPPDMTLAITPVDRRDPDWAAKERVLAQRTQALEDAMRAALGERPYLLDGVRSLLRMGDESYWAFMVAGALLAVGLAGLALAWIALPPALRWWNAGPLAIAVVLFFASWRFSNGVDAALSDVFSEFWQQHQRNLRAALKQAHADARKGVVPPHPNGDGSPPPDPAADSYPTH